jgi:acyl-CoA synthetase (NDP forming)
MSTNAGDRLADGAHAPLADGGTLEPAGDTGPSGQALAEAASRPADRNVAGLRRVFRPDSVAVVGAGRRIGTVGRAILHNIVTGGYQGKVYAVNPHALRMEGVRCVRSAAELPEAVDLAVITVPPAAVPEVADQCGRRGVGALVVVTAGLDALQEADLLAACRRYGMRLVGPSCLGIAVPGIGLDATFGARHPAPGVVGLVTQSGALGLALVDRLSRLGLGISSFASVGRTHGVSGDDVLSWWEQDETTRIAVLYAESFGDPRAFVAAARRVSAAMPVLAVRAGRPAAPVRQAAGPAPRPPLVTRDALFEQAGVIATDGPVELLATAALLASQPVPAGRRVAVISNVGGAAALAAEACADCGLSIARLSPETRRRLHAFVPPGGTVTGPVDTTATVAERSFRRCLELLAGDEGVDAVLALVLRTAATGDLVAAVREAGARVPLVAVIPDQTETIRLLPVADGRGPGPGAGPSGSVPAYADPETAAGALGRAAAYGARRSRPRGRVPLLEGVREGAARDIARTFLAGAPRGGWLPPDRAAALLACYGAVPDRPAPSGRAPEPGGEVVIAVTQDPVFGPVATLGAGEMAQDGDRAARLVPLTDTDADDLIRGVPGAGPGADPDAGPGAGLPALRESLLRVCRLAGDLPEIAEMSVRLAGPAEGASVVSARIRLAPVQPRGLLLTGLP